MCLAIDNTVCFLMKTGPCKPTVVQPWAGVELPPFQKKQNALTASVFAWLKKLSNGQGIGALAINNGFGTDPTNKRERFEGAVPRESGTDVA